VLAVKDGIYGACHLELPENSCMDLPTDFDCSAHIQLRFGGNHTKKKPWIAPGPWWINSA
jgi:hypothetical protein